MKNVLTLENFVENYEQVKDKEYEYLIVFVSVNDAKPEMIVNPKDNIDAKMIYYRSAYDSDLRLKANPSIRITNYHFVDGDISLNSHYKFGAGEL